MKKRAKLFFALPLLSLFFIFGCEEDLTYPGLETPVVFALLDKADSIHYVKITHSFGGNQNAIDVALIPDSSYYSELEVKIEEWLPLSGNGSNKIKVRTWTLQDTVLSNKQPGTFYSPDQKVYYFKTEAYNSSSLPDDFDSTLTVSLKQTATYKLIAVANGGEYTFTAETNLAEPFTITNTALALVSSTSNTTSYTDYQTSAHFSSSADSPKIFNAKMKDCSDRFNKDSRRTNSLQAGVREKLRNHQVGARSVAFVADGKSFYELLKANVTNDPAINKRQLKKIEIIFAGASQPLADYIISNKPLASALIHVKDSYTNVTCNDGRKAIGIFTSRYTSSITRLDWDPNAPTNRALNSNSVKALCTGTITGNLLFCSDNPLDGNTSYSCQ